MSRTPEGKAISSRNAIRHGLTSVSPLLPSEDQAEYDSFQTELVTNYDPLDAEDTSIVLAYVDTVWRLRRIPGHESRLIRLEMMRIQLTAKPDQDRALYDFVAKLDPESLETFALDRLMQQKSRTLVNLHRQEQRLNYKLKTLKPDLERIMLSSKKRYLEHLQKEKADRDLQMRTAQNELVATASSSSEPANRDRSTAAERLNAILQRVA
jgi:hypothetical protein